MIGRAVLAALLLAGAGHASTIASPTRMTCPVGGKAFSHRGYASYSTWGALPDGQPVGSAPFPIEIPECPDNGLVVYDEFDAATVRRLTPLVLGADYQRLRAGDTQRFRMQWLQARLGAAESDTAWTLLSATWEAKNAGDAVLAARYNDEFVRRARALQDDPASLATLALKARAVNALRELGRFDDAEALRVSLKVAPMMNAGGAADRKDWSEYLASLAPAIARRDSARAPIDLIGDREARFRCLAPERPEFTGPPLTDFERTHCARAEVQQGMGELRRAWGIKPAATPSS